MNDSIFSTLTDRFGFTNEAIDNLKIYVELLLKWNKSINLIGKSTEDDIWERHILDSAQLVKYLPARDLVITDFGSGAGLPGMVLAAFGVREVNLIESDNKKCIFLGEAKRVMSLTNAVIHNKRIENMTPIRSDIITSRAFSSISSILEMSERYIYKETLHIMLKGGKVTAELDEVTGWDMEVTTHKSITDPNGNIVIIKNQKRK